MRLKEIKNLLKEYKIGARQGGRVAGGWRPSRRLGQNFLIDERVLRKIIEAAELSKNDTVLEIGPGIGNLTLELAKKVKKVIATEKDLNLVRILNTELRTKNIKNVKVINKDILKLEPKTSNLKPNYKVVANIPYYLTSPLIRKFLETENPPKEMVLMVQKEVAKRICANPPNMSLLAISVQFYAKPEIIYFVSKESFWPSPKVDSAIIKISKIKNQKLKISDLFFKIVKAGFSQPRKQLINNLAKGLNFDKKKVEAWLLKNNIKPSQRAETLTIEDWLKLTENFIN